MAEPDGSGVPSTFNPREMFKQLSPGQMAALLVILVAGITLVVSTVYYASQEEMVPIYTRKLDAKTSQTIKEELNSRQIVFEVTDQGKILVPKSRAIELRTEFEANDINPRGRGGMDILDQTSPLKAGAEMMKLKKLQALSVDLQHMLEENPLVQKAKVQIVPAKDSPFADETEPAKASVMLRIKNYAEFNKAQVRGMQRLVAGAIEGADIDDVIITDHYYNLLTQPASSDDSVGVSQSHLDIKSKMERDLERKIHQIVETFLGVGKVKARVSLQVNFDQVEKVAKIYGGADAEGEPQRYSEQIKTEDITRRSGDGAAAGVAANAAQGNIPQAGDQAGSVIDRDTNTNLYLVPEEQIKTLEQPFNVERMSIALQLDFKEVEIEKEKPGFIAKLTKSEPDWIETESKPLSSEELTQVRELVMGATGFTTDRDFLSIQNFEFKPLISKRAQASMDTGQLFEYINKWTPALLQLIIFVLFVLLGVSLFRRFVAPILQQAQLEEPAISAALPSGPPKTVAELESELEQEIESSIPSAQLSKTEIMKKRLVEMVQQEPEQVSSLVRTWLLEDE